ncbi:hypothetical protein [Parasitella parasitica]|uniref:Integrase zinc-binding domain-containing protein n=1 Tax=Parasitella parasitica TaxID=35722 RepID=A0A0B7NMD0_9FUNG|nr:hypothetical protein [Parasitella parasitica]
MIPPESERKDLLLRAHVFGHFGAESIIKYLHNDGLHWPNLAVDAVELVKACSSCQKHNINKRATTMATHLVQVFSNFGYPTKISTDNGSENSNILFQTLCETSNGAAERFVQSSKLAIAKTVEGAGHQCDLFTPGVQLALNNKVSKRLNTPPFNLIVMSYEELIKRIDHMNEIVFPAINDRTDKYISNLRDQFDKNKNVVKDYPPGTHVMVRIPILKVALTPSYEGPFTIIRKTKGGSYVLQNELGVLMDHDYARRELKVVSKDNIDDDSDTYEIEDILEHKGSGKNTEYKIRWKE